MTMPWTAESKERAATEGRYLVKVLVQGRHVNGTRIEVVGDLCTTQGNELLRTVLRVFDVVDVEDDALHGATLNRDNLHALLSLVIAGAPMMPTRAHLSDWTAAQCVEVEAWAGAEHRAAYDDDDEDGRLPMPDVLRSYCTHESATGGNCNGCGDPVAVNGHRPGCHASGLGPPEDRGVLVSCGCPIAVDTNAAEATIDRDTLRDLVSLVVDEAELPAAAWFDDLTDEGAADVERWAATEHLDASDNDVDRVPMPGVLRAYLCSKGGA